MHQLYAEIIFTPINSPIPGLRALSVPSLAPWKPMTQSILQPKLRLTLAPPSHPCSRVYTPIGLSSGLLQASIAITSWQATVKILKKKKKKPHYYDNQIPVSHRIIPETPPSCRSSTTVFCHISKTYSAKQNWKKKHIYHSKIIVKKKWYRNNPRVDGMIPIKCHALIYIWRLLNRQAQVIWYSWANQI